MRMGGCVSTVDQAGKKSAEMVIDKLPEEGCDQLKRECKILLLGASPEFFLSMAARTHPTLCLGAGESGKSTIVKQMKITYQGGFSPSELAEYRPVVYKNVLDSAQQVIIYMKKIDLECVEHSNRVCYGLSLLFHADCLERLLRRPCSCTGQIRIAATLTFLLRSQRPSTSYGRTPLHRKFWTSIQTTFISWTPLHSNGHCY